MQPWIPSALAFVALTSIALRAPAQTPSPAMQVEACEAASTSEAQDQQVVDNALLALNSGGYAALAAHVGALREVMTRAPSCYPLIERRGDTIIVREDNPSHYLILAAMAAQAVSTAENRHITTVQGDNTYAFATLMLASHAVETRRSEEAIALLDRGLALQPLNQYLILEKVAALMQLRRFEECVTLLRGSLDNGAMALTIDGARFQRNLGVVLIDLNRLDEAEAALRESLRLEPGNRATQGELDYIAELRRGGRQRPLEQTSQVPRPPQTPN